MVSQRLQNLPLAIASLLVFATFLAVMASQPLFQLESDSFASAKLVCNLHVATLEAKGQKVVKRSANGCYSMLMYEFDNYSFFYVGEDMETFIGLAYSMIWLTIVLLGVSTAALFIRVRYLSVPITVANFFAGTAAFTSLLALVLMAQATGESKVAKRYGYSQSPSIKVTGWLPIFPFLQLVISEHLETIINPKKIVENAVRWVDTFKKKLRSGNGTL